MNVFELVKLCPINSLKLTVEATVATGFEYSALCECREKLGVESEESCKSRGRIYFNIDKTRIQNVLSLRSVDHVYAVPFAVQGVGFSGNDENEDINLMVKCLQKTNLKSVLDIWKNVFSFHGIIYPSLLEYRNCVSVETELKGKVADIMNSNMNFETLHHFINDDKKTNDGDNKTNEKLSNFIESLQNRICREDDASKSDRQYTSSQDKEVFTTNNYEGVKKRAKKYIYAKLDHREDTEKVLKFRATCNRTGKHIFGSEEAAYHVGGNLQDMFNWIVDLSNYDLNFLINISEDDVYFGIALTKESKHVRNIRYFGPTTLRATVCFNLLQLASLKEGDIIVDPLCGGGSISIEGSLAFKNTYNFCGDIDLRAVGRARENISEIDYKQGFSPDIALWDVKRLPLRDSSVDVFISDVPFGKRMGNIFDNRILYKHMLLEMARAAKTCTGRAVLLTADRRSLNMALRHTSKLWNLKKLLTVNIGGVSAVACVLLRTAKYVIKENT